MKSYDNLMEKFLDENNIKKSIRDASVGKKKRRSVIKIMNNIDILVDIIHDYASNFKTPNHKEKKIYDGRSNKERIIIVPKFNEHIVHHMVVNTMMPIFTKGMYHHTYASIPKRGLHKCMKTIKRWIHNDTKNVKYCLKLDIKKFFNSIDHDILKNKFHKVIRDNKFLEILDEIIDGTPHGIPLGFYTSQWFANWLLQPLDHYIKEELHVKRYARYMDDMVLFSSNKRSLHKVKIKVEEYLKEKLNLSLKANWQLFRFDYIKNNKHYGRALDFVGFRFFRDRIELRRSTMLRISKKMNKIRKKNKFNIYDARQLAAWFGWLDWTDAYKIYTKYVFPYMKKNECKKYISDYDKKYQTLIKNIQGAI